MGTSHFPWFANPRKLNAPQASLEDTPEGRKRNRRIENHIFKTPS